MNIYGCRQILCRIVVMAITLFPASSLAEQFSFVFLPDTQNYLERNTSGGPPVSANPAIFEAQTQWIANNVTAENIIYVGHLGDIVNGVCDSDTLEWGHADTAMDLLDGTGISYGVLPGNHDWNPPACQPTSTRGRYNGTDTGYANLGFGPDRFGGPGPNYGTYDHDENINNCVNNVNVDCTNDNNYVLFQSSGNTQFIAINLAYSESEDTAVLDWMEDTLRDHADRRAIITSHYILGDDDATTGVCNSDPGLYGNAIIDRIGNHPNVFLLLSAHCLGEKWVTYDNTTPQRACMGDVNATLSNYQNYQNTPPNEDSGFLRILRIDTDTTTDNVSVETFSPWIAGFSGTGSVAAHPGAYPASGTNSARGSMNGNSRSNFSFDYDFNQPFLRPSLVLLQDVSGSMGWGIDGTPGVADNEQRLAFAKKAATELLDLLQTTLAPEKTGISNIGIAKFGGATASEVYGLEVDTANNIEDAKDAIDLLTASGGTPLKAGVETAENMFGTQTCRAVVLLSDGYHNVPFHASVGDETFNNLVTSLDPNTRIFSVAFGNTVEVDIPLLQKLANDTLPPGALEGSTFFNATDSTVSAGDEGSWDARTVLSAVYNKILGDVMGLQAALDPFGRIGAGKTQSFPVQVTEHDRQVTFHVSWATPQSRRLSFRVFDSSGNEIPPPGSEFYPGVKIIHGSSYQIMTVQEEALRAPGRIGPNPWRLDVINHSRRSDETEPFMYSVLMDSGLKLHAELDSAEHVVGDTVTLTAELRQGRRPILDLTDVTVTVTAPEDGRGNWLSTHDVSLQQLDQVPALKGSEALAPVVRKGLYLTDIGKLPFPSRKDPSTRRLFDDGSHGDATAGDGIYTNRFSGSQTRKEGTYLFYFKAKGLTQNGNVFTREQQVQTYLSVKPTVETIQIDVVRLAVDGVNRFDVLVTPKDPYGNFLGPGHSGQIRVDATNARLTGTLRDLLDGSYSQTLEVDAGTATGDVNISISVDETTRHIPLDEALPSKFLIAYYLGKTFPHGSFNRDYDGDLSLGVGLEIPWKPQLSAVVELQHSRFDADRGGLSDTDWTSLTGGIKYFVSTGATQPYLSAGAGFYSPKSGSTEPGIYVGIGITHAFNSRWSASLGAQHHRVSTSGGDTEYSLLRTGLNYRW